ncbi:MAG: hypothetical protein AB2L14_00740 [Candidatus Xenobiia bacterium LiM19]
MKTRLKFVFVAFIISILLIPCPIVLAQDAPVNVTGIWDAVIQYQTGSTQKLFFVLSSSGSVVTGYQSGSVDTGHPARTPYNKYEIENGKITGKTISFDIILNRSGGKLTAYHVEGQVDGKTITGEVTLAKGSGWFSTMPMPWKITLTDRQAPAPLVDLTGTWKGKVTPRGSDGLDITYTYTLKMSGNSLTGTEEFTNPKGELMKHVFYGTVIGNKISFDFIMSYPPMLTGVHFEGQVDGNVITGVYDYMPKSRNISPKPPWDVKLTKQ